ncbi:hypothetical protein NL676_034765 [Syzygium grande]|nr:hypothetical protein NL676_034765 [Syzygium grande]
MEGRAEILSVLRRATISALDGGASRDQPLAKIVAFSSWSDCFSSVVAGGGGINCIPRSEEEQTQEP